MLKSSPLKGPKCYIFTTSKIINTPTNYKTKAFYQLQSTFDSLFFYVYFNPLRHLYTNLNTLYKGFGVMAYYI